jgi:hypothetical protein
MVGVPDASERATKTILSAVRYLSVSPANKTSMLVSPDYGAKSIECNISISEMKTSGYYVIHSGSSYIAVLSVLVFCLDCDHLG